METGGSAAAESRVDQLSPVEHQRLLNDAPYQLPDHGAGNMNGHIDGTNSNRDSGIQEGEFTEPQVVMEFSKELVEKDEPIEDIAQQLSRRASAISNLSQRTTGEVDPDDELCGWGPFSPMTCQRFRNPRWVLVWLSMAGVCQGMIVNGFVLNSISTLEKRFDLKSSETGIIASGYDFASLVCLIPVSYFGGVGRKPHWVGIGVLIMSLGSVVFLLPHFTTPVYMLTTNGLEDTCLKYALTNTSSDGIEDCGRGSLSRYKYVFILGQLLHGIGATPLYTLGVSYLDDNLLPNATSLYVAIFYSLSILGPAVGFLLGGIFLNIHTDIASIDSASLQINTESPKWVGAWWIGFIFTAVLSFMVALVLCGFPKYLPTRRSVLRLKVSEAHAGGSSSAFTASLKEFPVMLKKLLLNPTFVFVSLAGTMEGLILSGFATFGPKFVQNQFSVSASKASFIVGAIAVPAGGGGTFFGGWIIKHKDMKLKGIVRLCTVFAAVSFFLCLGYLIQCSGSKFAGINHPYIGESEVTNNLTGTCNVDCFCSKSNYNPVCGADKVLYYSPCHAGCTGLGFSETDEGKLYGNCSCIDPSMMLNTETGHQAQEGHCASSCNLLPVFLLFFFGVTVFTFLASMPALSATLRSVPENQKSFALGIQWLIVRAFGTIPAAPIIGRIIDYSCVLWQDDCGQQGSCYAYDNEKMGIYLMSAGLIVKFLSVVFLVLTYLVYQPPFEPKPQEPNLCPDIDAEIDFMATQEDIREPLNTHNETTEL